MIRKFVAYASEGLRHDRPEELKWYDTDVEIRCDYCDVVYPNLDRFYGHWYRLHDGRWKIEAVDNSSSEAILPGPASPATEFTTASTAVSSKKRKADSISVPPDEAPPLPPDEEDLPAPELSRTEASRTEASRSEASHTEVPQVGTSPLESPLIEATHDAGNKMLLLPPTLDAAGEALMREFIVLLKLNRANRRTPALLSDEALATMSVEAIEQKLDQIRARDGAIRARLEALTRINDRAAEELSNAHKNITNDLWINRGNYGTLSLALAPPLSGATTTATTTTTTTSTTRQANGV